MHEVLLKVLLSGTEEGLRGDLGGGGKQLLDHALDEMRVRRQECGHRVGGREEGRRERILVARRGVLSLLDVLLGVLEEVLLVLVVFLQATVEHAGENHDLVLHALLELLRV